MCPRNRRLVGGGTVKHPNRGLQFGWGLVPLVWALVSGPVVAVVLRDSGSAWVTMLTYHLGCAAAVGASAAGLGPRPRWRGLAVAAFLSGAAAWSGIGLLHLHLQDPMRDWRRWGLVPPEDLPLLAYFVGVNAALEEWFWRGAVLGRRMRKRLGTAGCRGLAVLGFLPLHLGVLVLGFGEVLGILLAASVLPASAIWTALCERTRCVWWAAASHWGADLGIALAYWVWLRPAPG